MLLPEDGLVYDYQLEDGGVSTKKHDDDDDDKHKKEVDLFLRYSKLIWKILFCIGIDWIGCVLLRCIVMYGWLDQSFLYS